MENSNEKEDMRALIMVFVIWLLLWCVDNRQYFFVYLPHHSDYEIVVAYKAFNGESGYMYRIGIMLSDI